MAIVPAKRFVQLCFLIIAGLAAMSNLSRPDYNLPLFVFLWWNFFQIPIDRRKRHQIYLLAFVAISCIQDLAYLLYWPSRWFSDGWTNVSDTSKQLHIIALLCGLIELSFKIVLLGFTFVSRKNDLILCKTDEYDEFEISTYHQTPPGPTVYACID